MVRIRSGGEGETGRPELRSAAAAPWPNMAGARGVRDLGHESVNRKHRDVKKLTASSPRANTGSRGGRSASATKNGGRWPWKKVRRALAVGRKQ